MNVKLRTRKSKGYTRVSNCNTKILLKIITYLNNQKIATITDLARVIGGGNVSSLKGGLAFLRNIKAIEKVYNPNNKTVKNRQVYIYRLNDDFKKLYNNLEEKPREIKSMDNKSFKINEKNLIEARINKISTKYPNYYLSIPINLIRKHKFQKGDIVKLKLIELLRLTKIKEFI